MHLTTESLACFVGGQLEIQNQSKGYIYRGEIESVAVEGGEVRVKFVWLAEGKGGIPPNGWIADDNLDYIASTMLTSSADHMVDGHLAISSPITGEVSVFFPPDASRLEPSRVEGLVLSS